MEFSVFLEAIGDRYRALFGQAVPAYDRRFIDIAQPTLSTLAACDAPYHTVDHTLQVIGAGQAILEGKQHYEGTVSPVDWLHVMVALLLHDMGYLKGACNGDRPDHHQYCNGRGDYVVLSEEATGAALTAQHVDRGRTYAAELLANDGILDLSIIQRHIEMTRFPVPNHAAYADNASFGGLCRAADLLGQLSDPQYLSKLSDLFQEFEETGMNEVLGYRTPADLRLSYPRFYRQVVLQHIRPSLRYLSASEAGRKLLGRLYANLRVATSMQSLDDTTSAHLQANSTSSFIRLGNAQHGSKAIDKTCN